MTRGQATKNANKLMALYAEWYSGVGDIPKDDISYIIDEIFDHHEAELTHRIELADDAAIKALNRQCKIDELQEELSKVVKLHDGQLSLNRELQSKIETMDADLALSGVAYLQERDKNQALKSELIRLKANPCTGCTHEPKSGDPYPTPCGECGRWWSDNFEEKSNHEKRR